MQQARMHKISDYSNPFDAISDFESILSKYTNAPYVVTTDCCTHAIELCFRYKQYNNMLSNKLVTIPSRTYISVPMTFHKLNIPYKFIEQTWRDEYNFGFTNVWDSARFLHFNMYRPGQMQCLSFGRTKPLEIGRGGAILLDDSKAYNWLKQASYDGRDLNISPWEDQKTFNIGYHYMMRPEECVNGINKLNSNEVCMTYNHTYPNLSNINILPFKCTQTQP
jgi:dTDP-4-amino-4,6-dideoxygalactose transaminase